jgi:hypothetical protein
MLLFPCLLFDYEVMINAKRHHIQFRKGDKFYIEKSRARDKAITTILNELKHPDTRMYLRHHPDAISNYETFILLWVKFAFDQATLLNRKGKVYTLRKDSKVPLTDITIAKKERITVKRNLEEQIGVFE